MPIAGSGPRARPDLAIRVVGGEAVVLDRSSLRVHQFNATASHVWGLCTGQLTEAEIADDLAGTYEVEPHQAAQDVRIVVEQFRELGLLAQD